MLYYDGMGQQQEATKKTTVYLPLALDQWIRAEAKKNRRSYNGELVWLLEQQKEQQEKKDK
jgi:hypothetical protein